MKIKLKDLYIPPVKPEDVFIIEEASRKQNSTVSELLKGLSFGMSVEDIAKKHNVSVEKIKSQLDKGIKVEMEHTPVKSISKKIAMDHLVEIPDYYTRLEKMESDAHSKRK